MKNLSNKALLDPCADGLLFFDIVPYVHSDDCMDVQIQLWAKQYGLVNVNKAVLKACGDREIPFEFSGEEESREFRYKTKQWLDYYVGQMSWLEKLSVGLI